MNSPLEAARRVSQGIQQSEEILGHRREIVIVDDDDCVRNRLMAVLELEGIPVTGFADGETFLRSEHSRAPVCVFLDVGLPRRSGLEVLRELNARRFRAPVFLISARDDIGLVVECLKSGARDFLRKPFDPYIAVERVRDSIEWWNGRSERRGASELEKVKFSNCAYLTRRESEVLAHLIRGASSAETGSILGIGKRTVENFRSRILQKSGAKNSIDLVRIVMEMTAN